MRRRLTVTGASTNIDGVAASKGQEVAEPKKAKKKKVSLTMVDFDF